jgi:hypothetical protein
MIDISRLLLQLHTDTAKQVITSPTDIIPIEYRMNNFGYRGEDFEKENEMLALGCSHTAGDGIPEENRWATILAEKMGMKLSNLALGGESTTIQIMRAFRYFEEIGHPKIIVALFPMHRVTTVHVEGKMESNTSYRQEIMLKNVRTPLIEVTQIEKEVDLYSKAPHNPGKIIPKELVFFYDMALLNILQIYCKTNNIDFFWSFWEPEFKTKYINEMIAFDHEREEGFCQIKCLNWVKKDKSIDIYGEESALDCHMEHRDNELFYRAADRVDGKYAHWGIHKHMHVADNFYKQIIISSLN